VKTFLKKIVCFLHHIHRDDDVGHKLRCSLGNLDPKVSIGTNILETKYNDLGFLATESFITDIWRECTNLDIAFCSTEDAI